jgi:periplasmic divalent cation tolerance protein
MASDAIQVMTTIGNQNDAQRLAEALLHRRLAACVQVVGPITSTYWWQGQIETSTEWQCLIKTRRSRYDEVERAIRELHSYTTPEILAIEIEAGSTAYLDWLANEVPAAGNS